MRVLVTDRDSIEKGPDLGPGHVVISIRDPDRKPARIKEHAGLRGVLRLAFDDAEPCEDLELPRSVRLMTEADAAAVWRFVDEHKARAALLVVHCEMGLSRSPAVAAAVTRALGGDDGPFFDEYLPNRFVYDLLLRVRGLG